MNIYKNPSNNKEQNHSSTANILTISLTNRLESSEKSIIFTSFGNYKHSQLPTPSPQPPKHWKTEPKHRKLPPFYPQPKKTQQRSLIFAIYPTTTTHNSSSDNNKQQQLQTTATNNSKEKRKEDRSRKLKEKHWKAEQRRESGETEKNG